MLKPSRAGQLAAARPKTGAPSLHNKSQRPTSGLVGVVSLGQVIIVHTKRRRRPLSWLRGGPARLRANACIFMARGHKAWPDLGVLGKASYYCREKPTQLRACTHVHVVPLVVAGGTVLWAGCKRTSRSASDAPQ